MINFRKYVLYGWLGFATPAVAVVNLFARLGGERVAARAARGMSRWWARGMLRTTGADCRVEGLENIDSHGPFVIMSNHRSHMDIPLLIEHLPFLFGFIVKKELTKIPVFGAAIKTIGCVGVSRARDKADHSVLDEVAEEISGGKNILIFPEGTRAPTDEFLPFKKGGAILAIKGGVPIVPVALSGTNKVIPTRILRVIPGPLLLRVGKPIPTEGLTLDDRDWLLGEVRQAMSDLYIPDYTGDQAG